MLLMGLTASLTFSLAFGLQEISGRGPPVETCEDLFPGFHPGGSFAWKESPGVFITAAGTLHSSMQHMQHAEVTTLQAIR